MFDSYNAYIIQSNIETLRGTDNKLSVVKVKLFSNKIHFNRLTRRYIMYSIFKCPLFAKNNRYDDDEIQKMLTCKTKSTTYRIVS